MYFKFVPIANAALGPPPYTHSLTHKQTIDSLSLPQRKKWCIFYSERRLISAIDDIF